MTKKTLFLSDETGDEYNIVAEAGCPRDGSASAVPYITAACTKLANSSDPDATIRFPRGKYLIDCDVNTITVYRNVRLKGNLDLRGRDFSSINLGSRSDVNSSCFLMTGGAGNTTTTQGVFDLRGCAKLGGFSFFWPNQNSAPTDPVQYPPAIKFGADFDSLNDGQGDLDGAVTDIRMINADKGIIGRNHYAGTIARFEIAAYRKGISVVDAWDGWLIEDGQFFPQLDYPNYPSGGRWPWYKANAVGLELKHCDSTWVSHVYGFGLLTAFSLTNSGDLYGPWAAFSDCGSDGCANGCIVGGTHPYGVDFSNTVLAADANAALTISSGAAGAIRYRGGKLRCPVGFHAYHQGGANSWLLLEGVQLGDTLQDTTYANAAVTQTGGYLQVANCQFNNDQPYYDIGAGIQKAIFTGNLIPTGSTWTGTDASGGKAHFANNY